MGTEESGNCREVAISGGSALICLELICLIVECETMEKTFDNGVSV